LFFSEGAPISFLESVILGIVQGATEFLPISSSGHLVILHALFGQDDPQLIFDVMVHVGTLIAIFAVFRKDIGDLLRTALALAGIGSPENRSGWWMLAAIVAGCIPTALIGVMFAERFERLFASTTAAGGGLIVTGLILMSTAWKGKSGSESGAAPVTRIGLGRALAIGTVQGLAIFPGVSRSGATIAVALLLGIERELAARFSFLLAIPAILGALVFELKDYAPAAYSGAKIAGPGDLLAGATCAAVTGIFALIFLMNIVKKGRLSFFAYYCWAVGLLAICFGIFRG
jgi:undecaprenyl-diphosphatase